MPLIKIHCRPQTKQNRLLGQRGDYWRIQVQAAAANNQANEAIVRFLAKLCQVPPGEIKIIHGQTSRHKLISLPASALAKLQLKYGQA